MLDRLLVAPREVHRALAVLDSVRWEQDPEYRLMFCRDSPIRFAVHYFLDYLTDPVTGQASIARFHCDMAREAQLWTRQGEVGRRNIWIAPREGGKALALDTPVLTANRGWTTHGELVVGDRVFDESGSSCSVVAVSERWPDRPCYRLTFSDGSSIVADAAHEWPVKDRYRARQSAQATEIIAEKYLLTEARGYREVRYSIPVAAPLQYPCADLAIAPYVLGAWLGDGMSRHGAFSAGDDDVDHLVDQLRREGESPSAKRAATAWVVHAVRPRPDHCLRGHRLEYIGTRTTRACRTCNADHQRKFYGTGELGPVVNTSLLARLRELTLLGNKHIPEQYLTASIDQRLALLQGLMDTDGTIDPHGKCEFSVVNERLAQDFLRLLTTLGVKARIRVGRAAINGIDKGTRYRIGFSSHLTVFRLPRKVKRLRPPLSTRGSTRRIVNVERVANQTTSCIQVDTPSHLYLAGTSLIPTHNSVWRHLLLPLWALAFGHKRFFLAFANTEQQAKGHLANLRHELSTNDELLADFPGLHPARRAGSSNTTTDVITESGVMFAARGIDTGTHGIRRTTARPSLILFDDIEPGEANYSPEAKRKRLSTLLSDVLPMNSRASVDLCGTVTMHGSIIHEAVQYARGEKRATWIDEAKFRPRYYPVIVERPDGSRASMWPSKWSLAELEAEEHTALFQLNMMNLPVLDKADAWWSDDVYVHQDIPAVDLIMHVDIAVTAKATSDFTAIVIGGLNASGRKAVLGYARQFKIGPAETRTKIHDLCRRYGVKVCYVEVNQGQDYVRDQLGPMPDGTRLETYSATGHKASRIKDLFFHYERGDVVHARPLPALEEQQRAYPSRAAHDDLVDSCAGAVWRLLGDARTR